MGVVALTLLLVSAFVVNRLDDYLQGQQEVDLNGRARSVAELVATQARNIAFPGPVVTGNGVVDPRVVAALGGREQLQLLSERLGQADVRVRFGLGSPAEFHPASNGEIQAPMVVEQPQPGQARESIQFTARFGVTGIFPYVLEVTLDRPYTIRAAAVANVLGLLAAIGLLALGLTVIVAAVLARRFSTPLRGLTEASRSIAEGELSSRVPPGVTRSSSAEIAELAAQFNAMAERLEESVAIIRRDRDRSRDFLADVSHELRTPIAALRMFNELMREHGEDDPAARAEFLESSAQQLDRLDWLAQNLLELSKLDSGLVLLDLRPDDLRAAVESAVEQARAAAERREVELRLVVTDSPIRIRHDPQRVGQVVSNLVANGIKFTPPGGLVTVEASVVPDGARIEVSDTGVGIEEAELPRIFDRFYRGSQANEARGSGSGLGLAIVRSIVDMHGGTVTVESRLGAGSRFTVILPRDPRLGEDIPAPARVRTEGEPLAAARVATPAVNVADSSSSEVSRLNPGTSP